MKEKPYLFLDFDFTCTYMNGVKDNLYEFLEFCVNNFKVYWCSYADYSHIKSELGESIDSNLLNKIIYKEVESNSKVEFIYYIIEDDKYFIYIDDDVSTLDQRLLQEAGLLEQLIIAKNNKTDIIRLRKILEEKLISYNSCSRDIYIDKTTIY